MGQHVSKHLVNTLMSSPAVYQVLTRAEAEAAAEMSQRRSALRTARICIVNGGANGEVA